MAGCDAAAPGAGGKARALSGILRRAQSRRGSLLEAAANVAAGIAVGFAANLIVLPAFGYPVTLADAAGMSAAFSAISVARTYVVRRVAERLLRA